MKWVYVDRNNSKHATVVCGSIHTAVGKAFLTSKNMQYIATTTKWNVIVSRAYILSLPTRPHIENIPITNYMYIISQKMPDINEYANYGEKLTSYGKNLSISPQDIEQKQNWH